MPDRKTFLTTLGLTSVVFSARGSADARQSDPTPAASQSAPAVTPPPLATQPATPGAKPPSAASLAIAATMRRFDAKLTDAEINSIAAGIDDDAGGGAALDPKRRRLENGDAPVTTFTVRPL